ncbi:hypothetical protein VTH06DRAFT_7316 [Thermothelomyces fergusii]
MNYFASCSSHIEPTLPLHARAEGTRALVHRALQRTVGSPPTTTPTGLSLFCKERQDCNVQRHINLPVLSYPERDGVSQQQLPGALRARWGV